MSRFLKKLQEQLGFIQRSCSAFDQGAEDESLRLATALRVIFHNTSNSVSLISHLGYSNRTMLSSSRGHRNWKDYLAAELDFTSSHPVKMIPMLGDEFITLPLTRWWENEPVFVHNGQDYVRRKIILSAANKDGGAHVDAQLEAYYESLCEGKYAVGITSDITYPGAPPFSQGVTIFPKNAHLALIRQFAHEALATVNHFKWF
jgi:hypothetical protein